MATDRHFVYVLRSDREPDRYYTGLTSNLAVRLERYLKSGSGVAFAKRHLR